MKSSKDINPVVGMQLYAENYPNKRSRIVSVENRLLGVTTDDGRVFHDNIHGECDSQWNRGDFEIEWIPPTDEERKMFVDRASNKHSCDGFCNWYMEEEPMSLDTIAVNYSLALDGADYDNMPEGFV